MTIEQRPMMFPDEYEELQQFLNETDDFADIGEAMISWYSVHGHLPDPTNFWRRWL